MDHPLSPGLSAGEAAELPARLAFISPFRLPTNAYIEMQQALVQQAGFELRPFSVRHLLLEGGWRGLLQRDNLVLVQWLEMRAFEWQGAVAELSLPGLALFGLFWLALKVARAPVVFVVHDHAVHDTFGANRALSQRLIRRLGRTADARVVHDPTQAEPYLARYLPHPLFWDRPGTAAAPGAACAPCPPDGGTAGAAALHGARLRCAMLGAIRPYKAIDTLLEVWPLQQPLHIAGRCSPDLEARLHTILHRRHLHGCVRLQVGHLSDEAFDAALQATDLLILPHASGTALVSGAFFEALGRVPLIVARRSSFIDWAASRFEGVHAFDQPAEVPALLQQLQARPLPDLARTRQAALEAFGRATCEQQWGELLRGLSASVPAATPPGTPAPSPRQSRG